MTPAEFGELLNECCYLQSRPGSQARQRLFDAYAAKCAEADALLEHLRLAHEDYLERRAEADALRKQLEYWNPYGLKIPPGSTLLAEEPSR